MKCDEFQVNWLEVCRVGAEELVNTWVAAECEFDRLVDKQRYRNDVIYIIIKMHPPLPINTNVVLFHYFYTNKEISLLKEITINATVS